MAKTFSSVASSGLAAALANFVYMTKPSSYMPYWSLIAIFAISGPSKLSKRLMYSMTLSLSALMAVKMSKFCKFLFSLKSLPCNTILSSNSMSS